jgi:hypothetical protein
MTKLTAQQPDLARVQHLVVGAPEKRQQLRLGVRMGMQNGLSQFSLIQTWQFS